MILALIVNFKWNVWKNWTSALKFIVIFSAVSLHWNCATNIWMRLDATRQSYSNEELNNSIQIWNVFLCQHIRALQTVKKQSVYILWVRKKHATLHSFITSTGFSNCFTVEFSVKLTSFASSVYFQLGEKFSKFCQICSQIAYRHLFIAIVYLCYNAAVLCDKHANRHCQWHGLVYITCCSLSFWRWLC